MTQIISVLRRKFSYSLISKVFLLIATIIFVRLFWKYGHDIELDLVIRYWPLLLLVAVLSFAHMALKGAVLYVSSRRLGFQKPFMYFVKAHCISTFIEISTLSGKFGSDTFKYIYWKDASRAQRFKIILLFRLSNIPAVCCGLIPVFFRGPFFWTWFILIIAAGWFLVIKIERDFKKEGIRPYSVTFLSASYLQTAALAVGLFQFYLLLAIYEVGELWPVLSSYMTSLIIGSISLLPLGLGAKDLTLLVQLKPYMPVASILAVLLLQRVTGDFITAGTGWYFSMREVAHK